MTCGFATLTNDDKYPFPSKRRERKTHDTLALIRARISFDDVPAVEARDRH